MTKRRRQDSGQDNVPDPPALPYWISFRVSHMHVNTTTTHLCVVCVQVISISKDDMELPDGFLGVFLVPPQGVVNYGKLYVYFHAFYILLFQ